MAAGRQARSRPMARVGRFLLRSLLYTVLVAIAVVMLFPYVWMLSGSLRSQPEIFANLYPLTIWTLVPKKWTLDNFRALLDLQPFPFTHYVANSLFVAVTVTGAVDRGQRLRRPTCSPGFPSGAATSSSRCSSPRRSSPSR